MYVKLLKTDRMVDKPMSLNQTTNNTISAIVTFKFYIASAVKTPRQLMLQFLTLQNKMANLDC